MGEEDKGEVAKKLIEIVNDISNISDYKISVKKQFFNLARRLKLLTPVFEEIRDSKEKLPVESMKSLISLKETLESAKELLKFGSVGSKIYLVLEMEHIMNKFQELTSQIERALNGIYYEKLEISNEVKEQVSLVLSQFRRAKGRVETPDADGSQKAPVIPDHFCCPISLELMTDPVIVSTGQTYERSCIEKWRETGHSTCPKTRQTLTNKSLTPNYVLRSFIARWCVANGIEPPKRPGSYPPKKSASACTPAEHSMIENLLRKLKSGSPEEARSAAGEIRLLTKPNTDNRVAIAEAGAIPLLVHLLSTPDSRTQEHAVTALFNLSICENNIGHIVTSGAVPGIVHLLRKGSMEARENAAATLFSLSVIDENKVTIGSSGAIPPLVALLSEGTHRGKKDVAMALFNLCIYQRNMGMAIRAGVVPTLMQLLTKPQGGMVEEALAILALLSSHPEGKAANGAADAVPVLVDMISNGSPINKENAAAVLVTLCSGDQHHLVEAQRLGLIGPLTDLVQNGTQSGRQKATQLLERMNRLAKQTKQPQAHAESQTQNQVLRSPLTSSTNAIES
ncbi:hypothetical protein AABB24_038699 [Solanum stoloniferum]|uniref:RING-type E3 ubiquitin transferase n=1 Tax=Solanum stoloniferum TaxID=62892 RepID=A0ABD2QYW8_9SOLN